MSVDAYDHTRPRRFAEVPWPADQVFIPLSSTGWAEASVAPVNRRDAWAVLAPPDAFAHPKIAGFVTVCAAERLDLDLFYADTAWLRPGGVAEVVLKPSFDLTQLYARDYLGPLLIVRGTAWHALGGLRAEAGNAALYDLALRAVGLGLQIDRIAEVLAAASPPEPAQETDRRRMLAEALARTDATLEVREGLTPTSLAIARRFDDPPPVTLVVPTMQGGASSSGKATRRPHIADLLESVSKTDWPMDRLTLLVGDDAPSDAVYRTRVWPFRLCRIDTGRPPGASFNYAAKMNVLWRAARDEHLVLLNDDVEATSPGWLKALMSFAVRQDVGAVGARLLFPNGRLQHAGVVGGLFGLGAHAWFNQPAKAPTYQDWALVQREWSIVTGAVLATRRSVLERVNGFDERFSLDFNDVDLCLKMRLMGLRVVYTPFAELVHHEKASRGQHAIVADQLAVFLRRWRELLDADPSYHPAMSRDGFDLAPRPAPDAWYNHL